ncbi:MAG: hypothetical protein IT379_41105 [Deltaproteobacteria bacterium]|nr:hypothetical protein [Deltaproteobacteria bacterium]
MSQERTARRSDAAPAGRLETRGVGVTVVTTLLVGSGVAAWLLPDATRWLTLTLALHVAGGAVAAVGLIVYVRSHLARTARMGAPVARGSGWTMLATAVAVMLTGALATVPRDWLGASAHGIASLSHGVAAVIALALLALHRIATPTRGRGAIEVVAIVALSLLIAGWAATQGASSQTNAALDAGLDTVGRPGLFRVSRAGAPSVERLADTDSCERCHADIVAQWEGSAHRFASFANPFYLHALRGVERARGRGPTKFCASCHDPLPLLAGTFDGNAPLSDRLPHADRGVTCLVCHATIHAEEPRGNGGLAIGLPTPLWPGSSSPAPLDEISRWLVRVDPRQHRAALSPAMLRTAEFCATCHKVGLPEQVTGWRFMRGFNDLDPWQQSSSSHQVALPFGQAERRVCVDCHMRRVPSRDLAAQNGTVLDHRFAAANTALASFVGDRAWMREQERMLAQAEAVAVPLAVVVGDRAALPIEGEGTTLPVDRDVQLHVLVTAPGVGHFFPGGTLDSHEAWVELDVRDASGRRVAAHGGVAEDGGPTEDAHVLRARLLDRDGLPIVERDAFRQRTVLYRRVAVAGAGELVRYGFRVPADARGPLSITTTLWFRKFAREFHAAVFRDRGEPEPAQPRIRLATKTVRVALGPELREGACVRAANPLLLRYAPSATMQGDSASATRAARRARACGGPPAAAILEARASLRAGDYARALSLVEPLARRPGAPGPPRMVRALALAALGEDDEALEVLQGLARDFRRDREVHREIARLELRAGRAREALTAIARTLAIDPEDGAACYVQSLAAAELGDRATETRARRCYDRYREDETQRSLAQRRRAASPTDDREAEPIHVHDATPR